MLAELIARDQRDRTRAVSPLVPAPDAVILDTTHKCIDEVVAEVEGIVNESGSWMSGSETSPSRPRIFNSVPQLNEIAHYPAAH